jgi:guanylate kinase
VLVGPGGAGKGTVAKRLLERDPRLWLSRSWTTRPRRKGEPEDAYVFVDRETFGSHAASGGFLEHAEFLGQLYGTPVPSPPRGSDVLLDIDLQGARQILEKFPQRTVVVLLLPPSPEVQKDRLVARGDPMSQVERRLEVGREEVRLGRQFAHYVVVNDQVDTAVTQVAAIVEETRSARHSLEAVASDDTPEDR